MPVTNAYGQVVGHELDCGHPDHAHQEPTCELVPVTDAYGQIVGHDVVCDNDDHTHGPAPVVPSEPAEPVNIFNLLEDGACVIQEYFDPEKGHFWHVADCNADPNDPYRIPDYDCVSHPVYDYYGRVVDTEIICAKRDAKPEDVAAWIERGDIPYYTPPTSGSTSAAALFPNGW